MKRSWSRWKLLLTRWNRRVYDGVWDMGTLLEKSSLFGTYLIHGWRTAWHFSCMSKRKGVLGYNIRKGVKLQQLDGAGSAITSVECQSWYREWFVNKSRQESLWRIMIYRTIVGEKHFVLWIPNGMMVKQEDLTRAKEVLRLRSEWRLREVNGLQIARWTSARSCALRVVSWMTILTFVFQYFLLCCTSLLFM